MKLTKVFAVATVSAMLVSAAPKQPTPIAITCLAGAPLDSNNVPLSDTCNAGSILFQGDNYGNLVQVVIDGQDMGNYRTPGGSLNVTFTFSGSETGSHTITVIDASGKNAGRTLATLPFDVVLGS